MGTDAETVLRGNAPNVATDDVRDLVLHDFLAKHRITHTQTKKD